MFRTHVFAPRAWFAVVPLFLLLLGSGPGLLASDAPQPGEPTDAKAKKSFASAIDWEQHRFYGAAIESYRKANKQDGGHCPECLRRAYLLARQNADPKAAIEIAREMLLQATTGEERAGDHYRLALALQQQGIDSKNQKDLGASCDEFNSALELDPQFALVHYGKGISLAYLHQDDAARKEFAAFLAQDRNVPQVHDRARRYMERVELARARMVPPFSLTTLDGRLISMDSLAGKVVLIDFWATWCGPCREALPHIRQIARKFDGQPLVVLSISLDSDETKWKEFVAKNGMTWLQYRDGGFDGRMAKLFGVTAIPAAFSIDADGVLEDQRVGDADIEGKLKMLIAQATEEAHQKATPEAGAQLSHGSRTAGSLD